VRASEFTVRVYELGEYCTLKHAVSPRSGCEAYTVECIYEDGGKKYRSLIRTSWDGDRVYARVEYEYTVKAEDLRGDKYVMHRYRHVLSEYDAARVFNMLARLAENLQRKARDTGGCQP